MFGRNARRRRDGAVPRRFALVVSGVALLAAVAAYSNSPLAFGAGSAYPNPCDRNLDIYTYPYWEGSPSSFWGTCWTSKTIGYTASGLSAWAQASVSGDGFSLSVDGYFGPNTDSKVKQWQAWRGITADGIVGNNSWIRMDEWGIRSWDTYLSCSSVWSGWQVLLNGGELAIRTCSGGLGPFGQGEYCVRDRYGTYVIADWVDPWYWYYGDNPAYYYYRTDCTEW